MDTIAVLKSDHEVIGGDGCSASWKEGDVIRLVAGEGEIDYVRKGVLVTLPGAGHLHVIPASILSFYIDSPTGRVPIPTDRITSIG